MRSILLQTTARLAYPGIMMFSFFLFFRGHDFPGGGFIGGLMASAGILLVYIAFGARESDRLYGFNYRLVASLGLLCTAAAGLLPMFSGLPFLTSMFWRVRLPGMGVFDLSTVLLFDFGVFLAVLGTVVGTVKVLVLEQQDVPQPPPALPVSEESD